MFRRQQVRSHNELMREEFGEGFDHLRMAAAHAAGTAAGLIAPRLDTMRERLEPSYDRSKRRANKVARRVTGKKEAGMAKRWPTVVGGLMIAGVAAGAVGALLSRRRQRRWNDYGTTDTTTTFSGIRDEAGTAASSITDKAKEKSSDVLGQMKSTTETTGTGKATPSPMSSTATGTGDFGAQGETYKPGTSSTGSRNSRP